MCKHQLPHPVPSLDDQDEIWFVESMYICKCRYIIDPTSTWSWTPSSIQQLSLGCPVSPVADIWMYEPLSPGATLQLLVLLPTGTDCGYLPGDGPWIPGIPSCLMCRQTHTTGLFTSWSRPTWLYISPQTNGQFTDLVSSPDLWPQHIAPEVFILLTVLSGLMLTQALCKHSSDSSCWHCTMGTWTMWPMV